MLAPDEVCNPEDLPFAVRFKLFVGDEQDVAFFSNVVPRQQMVEVATVT